MEKAKVHLFIKGSVQGVFYRAFTREIAIRLGLTGWVKNLHDGYVEAVFEGNREKIEQAILECRKGPPGSYVKDIELTWSDYSGTLKSFEINYY
jgi:acylphosphatase